MNQNEREQQERIEAAVITDLKAAVANLTEQVARARAVSRELAGIANDATARANAAEARVRELEERLAAFERPDPSASVNDTEPRPVDDPAEPPPVS